MPKKKPLKLKRKEGLYLGNAGHKGRGVFCTTPIRKGEVLEITPTLILNEKATDEVSETILNDYIFTVGKLSKPAAKKANLKKNDVGSSVIYGIITFCNHDENPNAEVVWEETAGTVYHYLIATKNIPKHTEICTTYGEGWFDDRK